jgi:hypothetical protein
MPCHAAPCHPDRTGTGRERHRVLRRGGTIAANRNPSDRPTDSIRLTAAAAVVDRCRSDGRPSAPRRGRSDATPLAACPAPLAACRATRMPRGSAWSVSLPVAQLPPAGPHLRRDWPTSAPGLAHICAGTVPTSAPGLAHICAGTGPHLRQDRGFRPQAHATGTTGHATCHATCHAANRSGGPPSLRQAAPALW